jgi:hypothetical protein
LCGHSTVGIVARQNRGWESTWERQFAQESARERQHTGWKKSEQRTKKCGRGWYEKRRTCDAIPHKDRGEQRKKQWQSIFWSVEIFLETRRGLWIVWGGVSTSGSYYYRSIIVQIDLSIHFLKLPRNLMK